MKARISDHIITILKMIAIFLQWPWWRISFCDYMDRVDKHWGKKLSDLRRELRNREKK